MCCCNHLIIEGIIIAAMQKVVNCICLQQTDPPFPQINKYEHVIQLEVLYTPVYVSYLVNPID